MSADDEKETGRVEASYSKKVAWPGRFISALLGSPKTAVRTPDGLRYPACAKCADSIGVVNVVANTFLMVMKGYLGVVGRSTALVADAIHSSADVVSSVMLLFGLRVAKKPKDSKYPYGYGKVEFFVALVIYSSLILAGIVIFIDAVVCIVHQQCVDPSMVTLFGALISVVVNEMMFRQSVCAGNQLKSPSIIANAWEKRSDALSSVAVFVGIAGAKMGWTCLDPLTAILVAGYILKSSIEGIMEAFKGLLDTALDPETVSEIRSSAESVAGVLGIEALRTREIGQIAWVDLEILVDGSARVGGSGEIKGQVKKAVAKTLDRKMKIVVYLKPVPV